jgi:hypothetical protein
LRPNGAIRAFLKENGRPDEWLYVGGTKAGPAVLWLYPFGGAPNGYKPVDNIDPIAPLREAAAPPECVTDCRESLPCRGEAKQFSIPGRWNKAAAHDAVRKVFSVPPSTA